MDMRVFFLWSYVQAAVTPPAVRTAAL